MVGKEHILIDQKVILDEINVLLKREHNSRVLKRLYFVKFRCLGDSVEESATKVGVTKKTGYYWQDAWNKGNYAALIPHFGGGRKSKLTDEQIGVILHSFNMYHSKPYTLDYRRPENAEDVLKKVNRSNSSIYWSR